MFFFIENILKFRLNKKKKKKTSFIYVKKLKLKFVYSSALMGL